MQKYTIYFMRFRVAPKKSTQCPMTKDNGNAYILTQGLTFGIREV